MMIIDSTVIKYAIALWFVAGAACSCTVFMGCDQQEEPETVVPEPEIVIHRLVLGRIQTNCYCLTAGKSAKDCLIIDTGADDVEPLIDFLKEKALNPVAAIFTHGHFDHINGATLLRKHYPRIKLVIHKDDAKELAGGVKDFGAEPIEKDGPIEFAGIEFEVFHTPGHTPGGMCLYSRSGGVVFTGDTLFAGSIGRTDLSDGSREQLISGIKEKLLVLPDEVVVYPGHGPSTTIGEEKRLNPFFK
jgi:glyoxylase-like metal-dependent hydrolase (beta-lactamase superfamily II)